MIMTRLRRDCFGISINILNIKNIINCSFLKQIINTRYSTTITPSASISLSHVKSVLQSKMIEAKEGYTCLMIKCVCYKDYHNIEGCLFINKVTGNFLCTKCKASGTWDILEKALKNNGSKLPSEEITKGPPVWDTISEECQRLSQLPKDTIQSIINRFRFKDYFQELLIEVESLVNQNGTHIYVPIKNSGHIVGIKELTHDGVETTVPNIGCKGIILVKNRTVSKHNKKEAVIVHSVKDMLALGILELSSDIICLPNGVINLPQEILPLLESYTKLTLWFDSEGTQWESARRFAKKLNDDRCWFVRPADDHPSPFKALQQGRNLHKIMDTAIPIGHNSVIHFSDMRQEVLAQLQNTEKAAGVKWDRFPTLNKILKGHRRGEMTVLTGPSGAGKTTFMSEYSLDLAMQGVPTLWGSFEIKNERLARTMLQQLCKFPLEKQLHKFDYWADKFEELPIYFLAFYGQQPIKNVMEAVEHATYVHDIAHVIIDNVQFMLGLSEGENSLDRFYKQDSIVGVFRNFATTANCHVSLVVHPRKERVTEMLSMNSIFGGIKATQEADNVLIIQQKTLQNLKMKKFLQVAKNRYSGDLGILPLDFEKESLSYATKTQKKDTPVGTSNDQTTADQFESSITRQDKTVEHKLDYQKDSKSV